MRIAAAISAVMLVASAAAGGEATYTVRCTVLPEGRSVNGFVQTVQVLGRGVAEVRVKTTLTPIGARGFASGIPRPTTATPGWFRLPHSLADLLTTEDDPWERATRVLRWVMDHVSIEENDMGPQDAASVLARGGGRCSGLANAAAAMLQAAGFSARTVSGVLISRSGAVPHRWLECKLPGAGWVPTDPTLGLWVITPRYVAWPGPVIHPCAVEKVEVHDAGLSALSSSWGWPVRWNRGAVLQCKVVGATGDAPVMAELSGPDGEERELSFRRTGQFAGLTAGRWLLTVRRGDRIVQRCTLQLERGKTVSFSIDLSGPGVG
ncbi:MAG TPA: transglutaminase domain-containing protein [Acidobacteria bacterium]|nr:transglutaminase domain-containing protein [Acidobacteriota bacterium]